MMSADPAVLVMLEAINEVIQRRGYVVMNSHYPIRIGQILETLEVKPTEDRTEKFRQPTRVIAETGRDDWNQQNAILRQLLGPAVTDCAHGLYYYRLVTD
jgi:hypothetical protein